MEFVRTGIIGLDEMLGGGIPKGHTVAVLGSPGTGKSILALQFIYAGLQNGENCVYISLEQTEESLITTAELFGWGIKTYIDSNNLELIHLSPQNIKAAIHRIQDTFPSLFKSFNAKRLAFDPVTLFEMVHDSEPERRDHVFNLVQMIKNAGVTALLTSEINNENPFYSKYGLIEYISDGIILLRQVRQEDLGTVMRVIEVAKMRFVAHSKEIKSYDITNKGFAVYSTEGIFLNSVQK